MNNKNIDKDSILELARHLIFANKKLHAVQIAEEEPKFLIKRQFRYQPILYPVIEEPKPIEIKEEIFDIGRLTKFLIDKMIDIIECSGPNQLIRIKRGTSVFMTDARLKEEEIKEIISIFSKESATPITPIFKAAAKGFSITAIISAVSGSRFVISRIKS